MVHISIKKCISLRNSAYFIKRVILQRSAYFIYKIVRVSFKCRTYINKKKYISEKC